MESPYLIVDSAYYYLRFGFVLFDHVDKLESVDVGKLYVDYIEIKILAGINCFYQRCAVAKFCHMSNPMIGEYGIDAFP